MSLSRRTSLFVSTIGLAALLCGSPARGADFDPNYILSDQDLRDYQSMGRAEINSFLQNKSSYLSQLTIANKDGIIQPAGEIIYQAAQEHQINPKYILVKLQKEQSLITDQDPTQRQIDWATGYGVCDSCDTTDPKLQKYKGFGIQVDSAAGIMQWYYDHVGTESWIKKAAAQYLIDSQPITPVNLATAFLYTYTPHLHGNQNFWTLWQKWFTQVYPDGTLLRADPDQTVYLIQAGKKRAIKNMGVLISRFNPKLVVTTIASELDRYPLGTPLNFPNYSILKSGENYYLVDSDALRPFADASVVRKLGYNPDEIIQVTDADLVGYTPGTTITVDTQNPFGRLIRTVANKIYYIKDGTFYALPDPQIAKVRFPAMLIEKGSTSELNNLTNGGLLTFPDGILLGVKPGNDVYVLDKGKRRLIPSEDVFSALGYSWSTVVWTDEFTADMYSIGEPLYVDRAALAGDETDTTTTSTATTPTITSTPTAPTTTNQVSTTPPIEVKIKEPPKSTGPITFVENGKMVTTSPNQLTYVGPKFVTPIDVYLVAEYKKNTATILASKNMDTPRPIASFTKVMTAYRLFNEGLKLSKVSTYNPKTQKASYGYLYRISPGEQVYNSDLLYSLLVSSLNTPAKMLVQSINPNEAAFVERMNKQAKSWGLTSTYFTDSYGYGLGNQSTARDYLTIFTKAIQNPQIKNYLGTHDYVYQEVKDKDKHAEHKDTNSNKLMLDDTLDYSVLASKTGFLNEAGYGIAMLVERKRDHKQFIIITMGEPNYQTKFSENGQLADWVIQNF